jgi:hypothetical protein
MDVALPRPQRGFLQISGSKHLTEDGVSINVSDTYTYIFVCLFIYLALYLEYTIV